MYFNLITYWKYWGHVEWGVMQFILNQSLSYSHLDIILLQRLYFIITKIPLMEQVVKWLKHDLWSPSVLLSFCIFTRKINLLSKQFSNHLMQGAESRQNNLVDCNINVTNERISCLGCNIRFIKIRTLIFLPSSRNQQKSCSYLLCSTVFSLVFRKEERDLYLLFLQFEK